MSDVIVHTNGQTGRVAAIYARVSSERQRQDETIQSQTAGLHELAAQRGLLVIEDLVFEDDGFSGATLTRPALERLRDRAAEGAFEVLLCHAPDRLARRYAYQVLLLEELARAGVEVIFARGGEHSGTPPVPGSSLQLTLDRDIQWQAQQALVAQVQATGSRSGSVIVMDPHTGEVLGLAGAPTFDPDQQGAAPEAARGDPAVSEVYEPGSVNKVITAAAALEAGVVTPDTPVTVPPTLAVYDRVFHDAEEHGVEHLTFTGVLAKSSNIGTVLVAQQLGKTKLYDALRGFGFGQSSGAGLAGESAGILPPPDKWSGTQAATIAFGQGVSVNALQMASVYATVANDGVRVPPRVVRDTIGSDGRLSPTPAPGRTTVVSPKTAQELRTMLEAVTSNEGTAPEARIDGFRVAGKTGTSQRVDPTCGCYRGYTASFVGMAPADNPQLVVAVVLQDPQNGHFGGTLAAPVFHDVMAFALQARQIPPTGTAAPTAKLTTD